ncbi:TPA: hypothetical protein ACH3X1_001244 [Trebouxia sp. C0004]
MKMGTYVMEIFLGPSVRAIQRIREKSQSPLRLGISSKHLAQKLLKDYGLQDMPFIVSEDGTAQQVGADIMEVNGELRVFGFNGETVTARTAQEFNELMANDNLVMATTLYVYTLVPLVQGAPPLFAISHDNSNASFTTKMIETVWSWTSKQLQHQMLVLDCSLFDLRKLNFVGFSFDGDGRLRLSKKKVFMRCTLDLPDAATVTINHPLMQMRAVHPFKDRRMSLLPFSDWLHIGFRFRTQWLNPNRNWEIGGVVAVDSHLKQKDFKVTNADLNYRNSQRVGRYFDASCSLLALPSHIHIKVTHTARGTS